MTSQIINTFASVMASKRSRRRVLRQVAGGAGLAAGGSGIFRLHVSAQDATPAVTEMAQAGYLVFRIYRYRPGGTIEEVVRRVEDGFVQIITAVPGFVEYFIVDLGPEQQMSVSIFADKAGADESDRRAAGWVDQYMTDLLHAPPEIVAGEIRLRVPPGSTESSTPAPS